jgi:hypothetical protein
VWPSKGPQSNKLAGDQLKVGAVILLALCGPLKGYDSNEFAQDQLMLALMCDFSIGDHKLLMI